jgi:hypothetical protein
MRNGDGGERNANGIRCDLGKDSLLAAANLDGTRKERDGPVLVDLHQTGRIGWRCSPFEHRGDPFSPELGLLRLWLPGAPADRLTCLFEGFLQSHAAQDLTVDVTIAIDVTILETDLQRIDS